MNTITSTDAASFVSPWETGYATGWLRSPHSHPEAALWPGLAILAGAVWALAGMAPALGEAAQLVTQMEIDLIISEGFVPDNADESWYDGRLWTGAIWLNR